MEAGQVLLVVIFLAQPTVALALPLLLEDLGLHMDIAAVAPLHILGDSVRLLVPAVLDLRRDIVAIVHRLVPEDPAYPLLMEEDSAYRVIAAIVR